MKNTIISLAILKVNWDQHRKDYIDSFIPFASTLFKKQNYRIIMDVNKVRRDFTKEWGFKIPYHPMITILNRARKKGIITKADGKFIIDPDRIEETEFSNVSADQTKKQSSVIHEFIIFCNLKYDQKITEEEANEALIGFLKNYDLDLLFAARQNTVLPEVRTTKRQIFLMNRFIKYACESDNEIFDFIVDIAIGHILASALLYQEPSKFEGKLRNLNIYFDTRFVFRLLGLEGEERGNAYKEFVQYLRADRANLFVFTHTYEEIAGILENCLKWIGSPSYDPLKASRALNYFVQNSFRESDVERFIVNIDRKLINYGIKTVDSPAAAELKKFQIDERRLQSIIIDAYKNRLVDFDEWEKELTIQKDVRSITSIYLLRAGRLPKKISDARHIFVTTNSSLAFASSQFEKNEGEADFVIPACLTDIFVGTILWLQSPAKVLSLNRKKIIGDCFAAFQPSPELLKKYLDEIEKLKEQGKATEEEYYLLRSSRAARELLEEKTFGDADNFTDKTPEEILEDIKSEIRSEESEKLICEKKHHGETKYELALKSKEKEAQDHRSIEIAERISSIIRITVFIIIIPILSFGLALGYFPNLLGDRIIIKSVLVIIAFLLTIFSLASGFNIRGMGNRIENWIRQKVLEFLKAR